MDPALFLADLEAKPDTLGTLADALDRRDPWEVLGHLPLERDVSEPHVVLLGMGSSFSAAAVCAARLRAHSVHAVAELASSDLLPAPRHDTLVVAISAGGGSRETDAAVAHYRGRCPIVLLTNTATSPLAADVDAVVPMLAGEERGGVACRSFQHTTALLMALETHLLARLATALASSTPRPSIADLVRRSAVATADLLDRLADWLPETSRLLLGPHGTHVVAPARRLSSAQQSALMLREGPRLPAYPCETGDWSHVDVYLTRSIDYRMLLLAGSRWEDELLRWTAERGSTVVAVGAEVPGAALCIRYSGDRGGADPAHESDDVRLLTEVLVAELVAASAWAG